MMNSPQVGQVVAAL